MSEALSNCSKPTSAWESGAGSPSKGVRETPKPLENNGLAERK